MNTLTLDIGNSRVKTVVWSEQGPLYETVTEDVSYNDLKSLIKQFEIDDALISSVRGDESGVVETIKSFPMKNVAGITGHGCRDFQKKSLYSNTLGGDRIAAYYGGETLMPRTSKLIVDAGTAITMDVVDKEGVFCGGNIVLGLHGRLNALHFSTALLPEVEENEISLTSFGRDTKSAILDGAINGITGEILYSLARAKKVYDTEKIIITGGDAETFLPLLKAQGVDVIFDPYLVTRGLDFQLRNLIGKN